MLELMTIGYEGLSLREFFDLLSRCKVERLIDVRAVPLSRKKGFSKTPLSEQLARRGIEYTHYPDLGCPKDIRESYKADDDWAKYTEKFRAYLPNQSEAL